jgi:hypothetical protein
MGFEWWIVGSGSFGRSGSIWCEIAVERIPPAATALSG